MSKRKKFESFADLLLKQDFRWPRPGDLPFANAKDGEDAVLLADAGSRLAAMAEGYKDAADALVEEAARDGRYPRDTLVYPIVFCYRHYLELSLKIMLARFGGEVGVNAVWDTHELTKLWDKFVDMVERYGLPEVDEADEVVAACIEQFAKIDPKSFSLRYPVTTTGKPLPLTIDRLDLAQLADVMEAIDAYFSGTEGALGDLVGVVPDP